MKEILLTGCMILVLSVYFNCTTAQIGVTKYGTSVLAGNTTSGIYNSGFGYYSLNANTTGNKNTGLGGKTLRFTTTGNFNTASGYAAMYKNETGNENTAYGLYSLFSNVNGSYNTAYGTYSLQANIQGSGNTSIGYHSLFTSNAPLNTAVGYYTLNLNTTGTNNTGSGGQALYANTTGGQNTAEGVYALLQNQGGSFNTASGFTTLASNKSGSYNTALGSSADVTVDGLVNATAVGYQALVDKSNKVRVGNTAVTSIGGQVSWTTFSDGRYKNNINENVPGLAFINSLRPVSYSLNVKGLNEYYNRNRQAKNDSVSAGNTASKTAMEKATATASGVTYSGFVAQEVEAAAKKINFAFSGVDKPETADGLYGLRYDNFVAPLVKAVQELSQQNIEMKEELAELRSLIPDANTGVTKNSLVLNDAVLEQNTPNPFNSTTTINYRLPAKFTTAKIVVSDNSGRTMKELKVSGSGKGTVKIDTSLLSGGAYNYSLYVDERLAGTKQMLRMK